MADIQITCNLLSCRKKLTQLACVTTCLHIFCVNHVQNSASLENCRTCLACGISLQDEFDVIQVNLNPKEKYKAMVLIGLNPEQILEIANRAINFFCYQLNYDDKQKENIIHKAKEQNDQLKQFYEKLTNKYQIDLHKLQRNIDSKYLHIKYKSKLGPLLQSLDKSEVQLNLQERMHEIKLQQQQIKEYKKCNKKLYAEIETCKREIIALRSVPNIDATFITSDTYLTRKLNFANKFSDPLNNKNLFPMYNYKNPSIYGESTNSGRFSQ